MEWLMGPSFIAVHTYGSQFLISGKVSGAGYIHFSTSCLLCDCSGALSKRSASIPLIYKWWNFSDLTCIQKLASQYYKEFEIIVLEERRMCGRDLGFLFALGYISYRELVWTVLPSLSALVQLKYFQVSRITAPKALKDILILLGMNQNPRCLTFWGYASILMDVCFTTLMHTWQWWSFTWGHTVDTFLLSICTS